MPQRKKKTRTKAAVPAWVRRIPPHHLEEYRRQYLMSGGSQNGQGWLDWLKGAARTVWNTGKTVHKFVKDNKLASRGLSAIGTVTGQPELVAAGTAAGLVGYGKRRKMQRGGAKMGLVQPPLKRGGPVIGIVQNPQKPVLLRL